MGTSVIPETIPTFPKLSVPNVKMQNGSMVDAIIQFTALALFNFILFCCLSKMDCFSLSLETEFLFDL